MKLSSLEVGPRWSRIGHTVTSGPAEANANSLILEVYFELVMRLPNLRRDTIIEFDHFFGRRVFWPLPVGRP